MCVCCGGIGQPTWQLVHACALRPISQPHQSGSEACQSPCQSGSEACQSASSVSLVSQPRQSGSEAHQSASSVSLLRQPHQSGSKARQSASSVRLQGPSVSLVSQALRPVSRLVCQPPQAASSVRLRGPSVSLTRGQGVGGSRLPGSQARKAVLPGPTRGPACRWALFSSSASIPNLPLVERLGPAGQQRRASPPGPARVLSFFS